MINAWLANSSVQKTNQSILTYYMEYILARGFSLFLFARDEVDEFFNSMDRDFDGRLSFEEFMGEESQIGKNWIKNISYISGRIMEIKSSIFIKYF